MISISPSESRAALTAASAFDERSVKLQLGTKHTSRVPDTLSISLSQLACCSFQFCMMLLAFVQKYSPHLLPFCTFSPTADHGSMVDKAGTVSDSGVLFPSLWW